MTMPAAIRLLHEHVGLEGCVSPVRRPGPLCSCRPFLHHRVLPALGARLLPVQARAVLEHEPCSVLLPRGPAAPMTSCSSCLNPAVVLQEIVRALPRASPDFEALVRLVCCLLTIPACQVVASDEPDMFSPLHNLLRHRTRSGRRPTHLRVCCLPSGAVRLLLIALPSFGSLDPG